MKLQKDSFTGMRPDVLISFEGENTVHLGDNAVGNLDMDEEAKSSLASLLPLLDGSRILRDIRQKAVNLNIAASNVDDCLQFLAKNGFLYQYRNAADAGHAARYSIRTSLPDIYLERIAGAAVVIIGEGAFPAMLEEAFSTAGIGQVTRLVDWCHELEPPPQLVVAFGLSRSDFTSINSWSKRTSIPLLTSWLHGDNLCFGPLALPGKTACFECVFPAVTENGSFPTPTPEAVHFLPGLQPLAVSAVSLIAGLSLDFLSGFGLPEYFTTLNRFNLVSGRISSKKILKNPRCPICGRLNTIPEGAVAGV